MGRNRRKNRQLKRQKKFLAKQEKEQPMTPAVGRITSCNGFKFPVDVRVITSGCPSKVMQLHRLLASHDPAWPYVQVPVVNVKNDMLSELALIESAIPTARKTSLGEVCFQYQPSNNCLKVITPTVINAVVNFINSQDSSATLGLSLKVDDLLFIETPKEAEMIEKACITYDADEESDPKVLSMIHDTVGMVPADTQDEEIIDNFRNWEMTAEHLLGHQSKQYSLIEDMLV